MFRKTFTSSSHKQSIYLFSILLSFCFDGGVIKQFVGESTIIILNPVKRLTHTEWSKRRKIMMKQVITNMKT